MPPSFPSIFEQASKRSKLPPKHHPRKPLKPLTNKGKILRAEHNASEAFKNTNPRAAPASSPNSSPLSPSTPYSNTKCRAPGTRVVSGTYPLQKTISKAISLPPPGELTRHAEEDLRAAERRSAMRVAAKSGEKGGSWDRRKKAVTNQEKMLAAEAAKGNGCGGRGRGKAPGLMKVLQVQSQSAGWGTSVTGEVSYIPFTERLVSVKAQRYRDQRALLEKKVVEPLDLTNGKGETKKDAKAREKERAEESLEARSFPFLALPEDVKAYIYRLVVVDTKVCIWPASALGREQPDLSMVCREVREALLPIYYGENTFAVDIAPPMARTLSSRHVTPRFGSTTKRPLAGLVAVQQWADKLSSRRNGGGKWLGMVKRWCFSHQDFESGFQCSKVAPGQHEEDESFIISVRVFHPPQEHSGEEMTIPVRQSVEVHREAACVMSGWDDCGKCKVQKTQCKLDTAISSWLQTDTTIAAGLREVVSEMRSLIEMLPERRCVKVRGPLSRA